MSTDYDRDTLFSEQPTPNAVVRIRSRKTDAGTWVPIESYSGTTGLRTFWGATFGDTSGNALITGSLTTVNLVPPTIVWGETVASPGLTHTARTTDAATTNLTLTSQGPVAGASSNRNPGNIILSVPAPAAGGTAGVISLRPSATETLQVYNNGTILNFPNNLWAKSVASPTLLHNPQTTDAACTGLAIASQAPYASATGSNRNPGNLTLTVPAPASGGTAGCIKLQVSGASVLEADPAKIFVATTSGAPGTNPTGGVYLYFESDTLKYRDSSGVVHTVTATTP